jgi:hypothetical protein
MLLAVFAGLVLSVNQCGQAQGIPVPVGQFSSKADAEYLTNITRGLVVPGSVSAAENKSTGSLTASAYINAGTDPSTGTTITQTTLQEATPSTLEALTQTSVNYFFEVVGPASQEVPVIMQVTGGATSTSTDSQDSALADFFTSLTPQLFAETNSTSTPSSFSADQDLTVPSDTTELVVMSVGGSTNDGEAVTLSAYVDPTFTIDPTFAQAGEFTIEYSANIIPEPASLGILTSSLVLLCVRNRQRGASFVD